MHDKQLIVEEPCEGKLSCTVLKTSGVGDNLAEFNTMNKRPVALPVTTSIGFSHEGVIFIRLLRERNLVRDRFYWANKIPKVCESLLSIKVGCSRMLVDV